MFDPATGEPIVDVADATVDDALGAVTAAESVAREWAETSPRTRSAILRAAFEIMVARSDELAELIVREMGKAVAEARGEVAYAAEFFRWFSEEAVRNYGSVNIAPGGDKRILAIHQPIGISVLVTPWNFPAAMATRKIAPALAAGCPVILKPASDTPLTSLALAAVMVEAGAPAGVVNVIPSRRSAAVAEAMLADHRVRNLSFTGSTEVGRSLLELASRRVVRASMELGGNAAFLVFEDADIDRAVAGAMVAKLRNGGQSCIAANRFLVHSSVADEFSRRFADAMRAIRIGPGMEEGVELGPMISDLARRDMLDIVEASTGAGARVVTGGSAPNRPGFFFEPTVLTDVARTDPILDREIFGPLAPVIRFDDDEDAIRLANATEYGLASYVYSADLSRAMRIAEAVEAGMVGINRGLISDPAAPFGGVKESGLGREGGQYGMHEYLETKYIAADW